MWFPSFSDQKTVLRWAPHFHLDQVLGIVPGRKLFANQWKQTSTMKKTNPKNELLGTPKSCFEKGDAFWTYGHLMVSSLSISGGVYFGNASWKKIPRWHVAATHNGWGKKASELGVKSLSFEVSFSLPFLHGYVWLKNGCINHLYVNICRIRRYIHLQYYMIWYTVWYNWPFICLITPEN